MHIDLKRDYFALFGLSRRFCIDETALQTAYYELHDLVHPEWDGHLSDAERRLGMQWANHVNNAFATLRKPLSRARYLLELNGIDVAHEAQSAMSPDVQMEQMEWREALEEAVAAADAVALEELHQRRRHQWRMLLEELGQQLDERGDLVTAVDTVQRLVFLERLKCDIDAALKALGR